MSRYCLVLLALGFVGLLSESAHAQITTSRVLSAQQDRFANLTEQLTNRLRATTREQRGFVNFVVAQVKNQRLDSRLVIAIERYAIRRNSQFPFQIFERALRNEAAKRGVALPVSRSFATTRLGPE